MLVLEVGRRNKLFMKSFRLSVENIVCRFCVSPFLFLYAISSVGCSYYSTSEGMIGGIRTLTIPVAESFTAEFAVAERLSERATELYMEDGRLRIVDQDGAEAVLYRMLKSDFNEEKHVVISLELFLHEAPLHFRVILRLSVSADPICKIIFSEPK